MNPNWGIFLATSLSYLVIVIYAFSKISHKTDNINEKINKFYGDDGRAVFVYSSECEKKQIEICTMMKNHFKSFSKDLEKYNKEHKEAYEKIDDRNVEARIKMFEKIDIMNTEIAVLKAKCKEFESANG